MTSNTIPVRINGRIKYCPFRWTGLTDYRITDNSRIEALHDKKWRSVVQTNEKVGKFDYVFRLREE